MAWDHLRMKVFVRSTIWFPASLWFHTNTKFFFGITSPLKYKKYISFFILSPVLFPFTSPSPFPIHKEHCLDYCRNWFSSICTTTSSVVHRIFFFGTPYILRGGPLSTILHLRYNHLIQHNLFRSPTTTCLHSLTYRQHHTMGVCLSTDEKSDRDRSQQIDRQLEEDNKKLKRECKILLLGT